MSTIRRILVPTDFSSSSREALDLACELAAALDAPLTLVHAYAVHAYPLPEGIVVPPADTVAQEITSASHSLQQELDRARARGCDAASMIVEGDAFDAILKAIGETGADLLVMGTHGRRGVAHALLGSVAEKLVRKAPCPVLTVRAKS